MRAKTINEVNFERGQDPIKAMDVGNTSKTARLQKIEELKQRGVKVWFGWDTEGKDTDKVLKFVYDIEKLINKLETVGVKTSDIEWSSADSLDVRTVRLLDSNHVIFECLNRKDAEIIATVCRKFAINQYDNLNIDEDRSKKSVYVHGHAWLDNLIENRKKFGHLAEPVRDRSRD
jgi:hypothetical protein